MKATSLIVIVIVIASLSLAGICRTAERPNIVVILADDLGWADLGCYGNAFNETPHIDRLAREGLRFTRFYAGPVCSPTRCSLQSGQDPARHGITQHIPGHRRPFARLIDPIVPAQMPLEVETFAEHLSAAGYRTGYFGKWHLGGAGHGPGDQGWQVAEEIKGNVQPPADGATEPRRTTDLLTDKAIAFIQEHRDGPKPFLLQIAHAAVHIPLSSTPELLEKYGKKNPMPGYPSLPVYAGLLEELDRSVGRIVSAIEEAGIGSRTLVWFLSDNGGLEHDQSGRIVTSNLPLRGEKGTLYEGGVRIPSIVRWPGRVPAGATCGTPLITHDLHPTVLALAGVGADPFRIEDGLDLTPLLNDPNHRPARAELHWHLPHYHHSTPASARLEGDWKLIEFFEDGALELYNLANDPGERDNLATRHPDRARAMHKALDEWRRSFGARMPEPNPAHDPSRAHELGGERRKKL